MRLPSSFRVRSITCARDRSVLRIGYRSARSQDSPTRLAAMAEDAEGARALQTLDEDEDVTSEEELQLLEKAEVSRGLSTSPVSCV